RRQQGVRRARLHLQIDYARAVVDVEDSTPGLAPVRRLVDAALLIGSIKPAEGADIHDVRILGVDDDAADLVRLLESHVLPGLAAVGRLVNAVAVGDRVARIGFAGADPDDIPVGRGDAHVTDGNGGLVIEL